MSEPGPILDLAALTIEVTRLERAERYYAQVFGLRTLRFDEAAGVLELAVNDHQRLRCWRPTTRRRNDERLAPLGARGGTHLHFAWQIPLGSRDEAKRALDAHGIDWVEIDLGSEASGHDLGLYFFDPFGHGLELREVSLDPLDPRRPACPPPAPARPPFTLPVVGLREVALAFSDFPAMVERLPRAYGLALEKLNDERDFAQFTLGPTPEEDGHHTPRRWLYAWDPQVGLADMLGGEHATVTLYADLAAVEARARAAGLPLLRDELGLAVRDPEGHVLEFVALEGGRAG